MSSCATSLGLIKITTFLNVPRQYLGTTMGKINIHIFFISILNIHILTPYSVLASFCHCINLAQCCMKQDSSHQYFHYTAALGRYRSKLLIQHGVISS